METQATVKEHVVPKFYWKKFSDDKGFLCVYDRIKQVFFPTTPDDFLYRKNAYETKWENADERWGDFVLHNHLEKEFGKRENCFNALLEKALERCARGNNKECILDVSEKELFAEMVSNIYLRNPDVMRALFPDGSDYRTMELYEGVATLFDICGWGSPESLFEHAEKEGIFALQLEDSPIRVMMRDLQKMSLTFYTTKKVRFMTSSKPVLIKSEKQRMYIVFPMSPHVVALFTDNERFASIDNTTREIEDSDAIRINQLRFLSEPNEEQYLVARDRHSFDGLPYVESTITNMALEAHII